MDATLSTSFAARLDEIAAATDALLDRLLSDRPAAGETLRPARLV